MVIPFERRHACRLPSTLFASRFRIALLALGWPACATNPVTGQTRVLLHERGAGDLDRAASPKRRSKRRWGSTTIPSCSATSAISAGAWRRSPSARSSRGASLSWMYRRSTRLRYRAAHLRHARHPAVSRQTRRSWRASSATRSATSRRGIRRSSTRGRSAGSVGLTALGIFVPAARPFGDLPARRSACSSSSTAAGTSCRPTAGRALRGQLGWDPAACAGIPLDARAPRRGGRGSARGAELALDSPDPLLRVDEIQPTVEKLKAAVTKLRRPIATRFCSASTASSSVTTRSRASRAATRSSIRCCGSVSTSRQSWEIANSPHRWWPRRPRPTCS